MSPNAPTVETQSESIEFAGVVSEGGKKPDLIFFDKTAKKNRWVPLGQTVEGISVLNYDERLNQVVVKINGVQKTLSMRKGTGPANTLAAVPPMHTGFNSPPPLPGPAGGGVIALPAPVGVQAATAQPPLPGPALSATPATPAQETQAKQETEARMLVSDLLEIGMAQRKAYEDAQRKAQGGGDPAATAPSSTNPPTPPLPQPPPQGALSAPLPGR